MNIMVFDTETTSLEKPFTYNIGYTIYDTETDNILVERDFVVEQVWHNLELFSSAYYAQKRPLYVDSMRSRKTIMDKYGYIMGQMIRDIKNYLVQGAYAYNSPFDDKVFNFCCEWYKCKNPFDNIPIFDIRGYAHQWLVDDEYKRFCEENGYLTESGNYSTTAETMYRYITKDLDFDEEHTALADSEIELEILRECLLMGAELNTEYKVFRSVERETEKVLTIVDQAKTEHHFVYKKKTVRGEKIYLK